MNTQPKSIPIIVIYILTSIILPYPIAMGLMLLSKNGLIPSLPENVIALYINMFIYFFLPLFSIIYYHKKIAMDIQGIGQLLAMVIPLILMVYGASIIGGIFIQQIDHSSTTTNQTYLNHLKDTNFYFTTYMAVIAAPITEESVFRCAMIKNRKGFAGICMILISSALFALAHTVEFALGAFLAYFFIALVLGGLYMNRQNLILNILVHAGYNTLALILSYFTG